MTASESASDNDLEDTLYVLGPAYRRLIVDVPFLWNAIGFLGKRLRWQAKSIVLPMEPV